MSARVWLNNRWILYNDYLLLELALKKYPLDIQKVILDFY